MITGKLSPKSIRAFSKRFWMMRTSLHLSNLTMATIRMLRMMEHTMLDLIMRKVILLDRSRTLDLTLLWLPKSLANSGRYFGRDSSDKRVRD